MMRDCFGSGSDERCQKGISVFRQALDGLYAPHRSYKNQGFPHMKSRPKRESWKRLQEHECQGKTQHAQP